MIVLFRLFGGICLGTGMGIAGLAQISDIVLKTPDGATIRCVLIQITQRIFASPARPKRIFSRVLCFGPLPGVVEEKFS